MREKLESMVSSDEDVAARRPGPSCAIYSCGCMVIAFGSIMLLAATLAIVWTFVPSMRWDFAAAVSEHHAFYARVYKEALSSGEASLAYQQSDERFKAVYSERQLAAYFKSHPELLQLPGSISMTSRGIEGEQFRSVSFNDQSGRRIEIFVTESKSRLFLLGISPDLADGIPIQVRDFDMFDGDPFDGDLF